MLADPERTGRSGFRTERRLRWVWVAPIGLVLALGIVQLWTPFFVDQAIFLLGGRALAEGEVLYRDFWDIKQPGVFWFYAFAGRVLGFHEPGVHGLELLWQMGAAIALFTFARRGLNNPGLAGLAPVAVVGSYYAFAAGPHLTQVEALLMAPIALSLVACERLVARPDEVRWPVLLGLAAGVTAALKLVYAAIPVGFALLAAFFLRRSGQLAAQRTLRGVLWALAGGAAVWLPILAYFGVHRALGEFWWTNFVYPGEALDEATLAPTSRLIESSLWLLRFFWPVLPLAVIGLVRAFGSRSRFFGVAAALYLALAVALIVVQRMSWWEYHFVLAFPPLGLLAVLGLDRLVTRVEARPAVRRWALPVGLLALVGATVLFVTALVAKVQALVAAARVADEAALSVRMDDRYLSLWREARRYLDGAKPGPLYVFGDSRLILVSGRRQAISVRGHAWAHLTEELVERATDELIAARPPHVYLFPYDESVVRERAPRLWSWLQEDYHPVRGFRSGRWFEPRPPPIVYPRSRTFRPQDVLRVSDPAILPREEGAPIRYTRRWQFALFGGRFDSGKYRFRVKTVPARAEAYLQVLTADGREIGAYRVERELVVRLPWRTGYRFKIFARPRSEFVGLQIRPADAAAPESDPMAGIQE